MRREVSRLRGVAVVAVLLALAACTEAPTAVRLAVRYEPGWQLDAVGLTVGDQTISVVPSAEVLLLVPDAWAGAPLAIAARGFRADEQLASGEVEVTPARGEVVAATLRLTAGSGSCTDMCELGLTLCAEAGAGVTTCELRAGCTAWSAPVACGSEAPACSNGACVASCEGTCAPELVADATIDAAVILDATHVYWADLAEHTLRRRPKQGGTDEVVAVHERVIEDLTSDATHLYWVDSERVHRVVKTGGPVQEVYRLTGAESRSSEIAVDANHVYWIQRIDLNPVDVKVVMRRPHGGGLVEAYSVADPGVSGLTLDDTHVYWYDEQTLWRRAKAGGAQQALATIEGSTPSIAVDATHVYLALYTRNVVVRVARGGGPLEPFAQSQGGAIAIASRGGHVYWANRNDRRVMRQAKSGGAAVALATGQMSPDHLAIDDDHVYWAVGGAGALMRLPRCACEF